MSIYLYVDALANRIAAMLGGQAITQTKAATQTVCVYCDYITILSMNIHI